MTFFCSNSFNFVVVWVYCLCRSKSWRWRYLSNLDARSIILVRVLRPVDFSTFWSRNSQKFLGYTMGRFVYIIYFHFRVRLRLGVAWDWRSATRVTSPFEFFQSFFTHRNRMMCFSLWLLDLEFSLTIQMQRCLFVERLRTCWVAGSFWIEAGDPAADLESPKVVCVLPGIFQELSRIQNTCQKLRMFVVIRAEAVPQGLQWFGKFRISCAVRGGSW